MCELLNCMLSKIVQLSLNLYNCHDLCRSDLACQIALDATATVSLEDGDRREIDIKRYAKVEKVQLCLLFYLI